MLKKISRALLEFQRSPDLLATGTKKRKVVLARTFKQASPACGEEELGVAADGEQTRKDEPIVDTRGISGRHLDYGMESVADTDRQSLNLEEAEVVSTEGYSTHKKYG